MSATVTLQQVSWAWLTGIAGSILIGAITTASCAAARPRTQPPTAGICEEAVVSPVSGYAQCVRPRGAPVAAPPPRPVRSCSEIANGDTEEARYCATDPETLR